MYNFTIVGQRGTLFWHAHISWLRATVYGPLIILPMQNASYPFAKPYKEVPITFGNYKIQLSPSRTLFFVHLLQIEFYQITYTNYILQIIG